jgi:hypothetical protein
MFFGLLPFNTLDYIFIAVFILIFMEAIFLLSVKYNKEKLEWPHDENTRRWLANQPLWHDHDMFIALCWGAFLGFLIGQLV